MRFAVVPHPHEDGSPDEHEVVECPSEGDACYEPGAIAIFAEGAEGVLVSDYHWECLRLAPGQLLHSENCNHDRR